MEMENVTTLRCINCSTTFCTEDYTNESSFNGSDGELWRNGSICGFVDGGSNILDIRNNIYPIMMPIILGLCSTSLIVSASIVCCAPFIKRPISPTIRLSLSLAAANTAFASVVLLGTVVQSFLPYAYGIILPTCLLLAVEALRMGIILVQVYHLLAVALIHYLGTLKPLHCSSILTPQYLKLLISVLWVFPILGMFIWFSSVPDQGFQSEQCENNYFRLDGVTFRIIWALLYFGPTLVLVVVYFHIFFILRNRGTIIVRKSIHRKKFIKNLKTVQTTALIVATFLIGWSPAVLAFLLICKECPVQINDKRISIAIFSSCYILFMLKVFVDTFIYALRLPEIREALTIMCVFFMKNCFSSEKVSRRYLVYSSSRDKSSGTTKSTNFYSTSSNSGCSMREKRPPMSIERPSKNTSETVPLCQHHNKIRVMNSKLSRINSIEKIQ